MSGRRRRVGTRHRYGSGPERPTPECRLPVTDDLTARMATPHGLRSLLVGEDGLVRFSDILPFWRTAAASHSKNRKCCRDGIAALEECCILAVDPATRFFLWTSGVYLMENSKDGFDTFGAILATMAGSRDELLSECLAWLSREVPRPLFRALVETTLAWLGRRFDHGLRRAPYHQDSGMASACKLLSLLWVANQRRTPAESEEASLFYFTRLDRLDRATLLRDMRHWLLPARERTWRLMWSQHPHLLSLGVKRRLASALFAGVIACDVAAGSRETQRRVHLRRTHLTLDSYAALTAPRPSRLLLPLRVSFVGEPGVDIGGLTREWFSLMAREFACDAYGAVQVDATSGRAWLLAWPETQEELGKAYRVLGTLLALSLFHAVPLDLSFPTALYRYVLAVALQRDPPTPTLADLAEWKPDLAMGLQALQRRLQQPPADSDSQEIEEYTWTATSKTLSGYEDVDLIPGGRDVLVTPENVEEYVNAVARYYMHDSVANMKLVVADAFAAQLLCHRDRLRHVKCVRPGCRQRRGLCKHVESRISCNECDRRGASLDRQVRSYLQLITPKELRRMVEGDPLETEESVFTLRTVTAYDGFDAYGDPTIEHFWEVMAAWPADKRRKLLMFVTGSDRLPLAMDVGTGVSATGTDGHHYMTIRRVHGTDRYPSAHTCGGELHLPAYGSRATLEEFLSRALADSVGFGFT